MDELSLYEAILQLESPWFVEQVELLKEQSTVNVYVSVDSSEQLCCPECDKPSPRYDHRQRRWRHLDTCQYKTYVVADVPRVECAEHGCLTVNVPWSEQRSRFTMMFESMVIGWLKNASVSAVCEQLRMSWNAVDGIMQRAVARGQRRKLRQVIHHICVDEVSVKKSHQYMTIISDQQGEVLSIEDGKSKESLGNYYKQLDKKARTELSVISMDMSPAYLAVTLEMIPDARMKIAFDRFHVAQEINKAVDLVRREESHSLHKVLKDKGLTGHRYVWLRGGKTLSSNQRAILGQLSKIALKTGRAWMLKEYAKNLWGYQHRGWAERGWRQWCTRAMRSRLRPFRTVVKTIRKNLWGIVNAIIHNANNGIAESVNSKIKMIKVKARGFRNKERFKTAIMFHCGGLSLYPETHSV